MMAELMCNEDVRKLLEQFANNSFRSKDSDKSADVENVQEKCVKLFLKDYPSSILIPNFNGDLSTSYPSTLIVPVSSSGQRSRTSSDSNGQSELERGEECTENDCRSLPEMGSMEAGHLRDLMLKARVARCRARFPVPVILIDDKYICRSATLSGGPEIYGRSGFDLLFPSNNDENDSNGQVHNNTNNGSGSKMSNFNNCNQTSLPSLSTLSLGDSSQVFSKVRTQDINLLKCLGVKYICDLMVEKKKVKFGLNITSSEKADKECRYNDFEILSLPYPGCEFFRDYRDKGYSAEGLVFDWSQNFVDAILDVPDDYKARVPDIIWNDYKSWDILTLTSNYLKLLINLLSESESSILIHCISGWDRTPLFISLLRLSLWADGKIHQSLSPLEITYLTLAYDWYLFGHNLNDRLTKGEEILFFCFYFLKFIISDDFNFHSIQNSHQVNRNNLNGWMDASNGKKSGANCQPTSPECNLEDSLIIDEMPVTTPVTSACCYLGSSTSLNSTSSIGSGRSQGDIPPTVFPASSCGSSESGNSFYCIKSPNSSTTSPFIQPNSYPNTPPTLTNSEQGSDFLNKEETICDVVDSSPIPRRVSRNGSGMLDTVKENDQSDQLTSAIGSPKTTTPVPIPGVHTTEKRKVSIGDEAWQMVSDTGSIKDNVSAKGFVFYNSPDSPSPFDTSCSGSFRRKINGHSIGENDPNIQQLPSGAQVYQGRNSQVKKSWSMNRGSSGMNRKEKLQAVRSLFYNTYSTVIGFRFKHNGTEPSNGSTASGFSSLFYSHLTGGGGYSSGRVPAPN